MTFWNGFGWFEMIFSSKKVETPTTQDAIQKLRDQEELLQKKQDYLENKIAEEVSLAKQYGTKNKRMALQALTRKKQHEKQLQHIDGIMQNIDFQRNALENASMDVEVVKVLKEANKAYKSVLDMDADQVHELMDDIAEQQEIAKEISDAISNPVDQNMDELVAELEALNQEEVDKQLLDVANPSAALPEVPSRELPQATRNKPAAKVGHDKGLENLEM